MIEGRDYFKKFFQFIHPFIHRILLFFLFSFIRRPPVHTSYGKGTIFFFSYKILNHPSIIFPFISFVVLPFSSLLLPPLVCHTND
jgi:hypothetical protein